MSEDEERWMKERAVKDLGAPALSKYYSKQEKGRKDRLKQVKSVVSSQMGKKSNIKKKRRPVPSGGLEKPARHRGHSNAFENDDDFDKETDVTEQQPHISSEKGAENSEGLDPSDNPLARYLEAFHKSLKVEDPKASPSAIVKDSPTMKAPPVEVQLGFSPDSSAPQQALHRKFCPIEEEEEAQPAKHKSLNNSNHRAKKAQKEPDHRNTKKNKAQYQGKSENHQGFTDHSALDLVYQQQEAFVNMNKKHKEKEPMHLQQKKESVPNKQSKGKLKARHMEEKEEEEEDEGRPNSSPALVHKNVEESARGKPRNYNSAPVGNKKKGLSDNHLPNIYLPIGQKNLGAEYREKRKQRPKKHPMAGGPKKFLEDPLKPHPAIPEISITEEAGPDSPMRFPMKPRRAKQSTPESGIRTNAADAKVAINALASPRRLRVVLRQNDNNKQDDVGDAEVKAKKELERQQRREKMHQESKIPEYKKKNRAKILTDDSENCHENGFIPSEQGAGQLDNDALEKAYRAVGKQRHLKDLKSEHEEALELLKELQQKPLGRPSKTETNQSEGSDCKETAQPNTSRNKSSTNKENLELSLDDLKKKAESSNNLANLLSARSNNEALSVQSSERPVSREQYKKWWQDSLQNSQKDSQHVSAMCVDITVKIPEKDENTEMPAVPSCLKDRAPPGETGCRSTGLQKEDLLPEKVQTPGVASEVPEKDHQGLQPPVTSSEPLPTEAVHLPVTQEYLSRSFESPSTSQKNLASSVTFFANKPQTPVLLTSPGQDCQGMQSPTCSSNPVPDVATHLPDTQQHRVEEDAPQAQLLSTSTSQQDLVSPKPLVTNKPQSPVLLTSPGQDCQGMQSPAGSSNPMPDVATQLPDTQEHHVEQDASQAQLLSTSTSQRDLASPEPLVTGYEWRCGCCDFVNPSTALCCEVCEIPRNPSESRKEDMDSNVSPVSVSPEQSQSAPPDESMHQEETQPELKLSEQTHPFTGAQFSERPSANSTADEESYDEAFVSDEEQSRAEALLEKSAKVSASADISGYLFPTGNTQDSETENSASDRDKSQTSTKSANQRKSSEDENSDEDECSDDQIEAAAGESDEDSEGEEGVDGKIFVGDGKYLSAPSLTKSPMKSSKTRPKKRSDNDDEDYGDEGFELSSDDEDS